MRTLLVLPVLLIGLGCQGLHRVHTGELERPICDAGPTAQASCPPGPGCPVPCPPPPPPCQEVRVKAPPQKVVVNIPAPAAQSQAAVAQVAAGVQQDVLLIPRTVFVPYVQQTPLTAARIASFQGVTAVGQTTLATGQVAGAQLGVTQQATTPQTTTPQTATPEEILKLLQRIQSLEEKLKLYQCPDDPNCPKR